MDHFLAGTCWKCLFPVMERGEHGWVCPKCGWGIPDRSLRTTKKVRRTVTLCELPAYLDYLEGTA